MQGMWAPGDAPSKSKPSNGSSYVYFDLDATQVEDVKGGWYNIIVWNLAHKKYIGEQQNGTFCCNENLQKQGYCDTPGEIIFNYNGTDEVGSNYYKKVYFNATSKTSNFIDYYHITESGLYYIDVINCDDANAGDIQLAGEIIMMNPYGYLSGEWWAFLPFYGIMTFFYMLLLFWWLYRTVRYRGQILKLQHVIATVIVIGILENATLCFDYVGYNNTGDNFIAAMIMGVLFSSIRKTVSRVVLLMVCMGYGVVRPTLGTTKYRIAFLGFIYIFFSGLYDILQLNSRRTGEPIAQTLFVVFPIAVIDTIFYWWIFLSIIKTGRQLTERKQPIKLAMYNKLGATLVVSGAISLVLMVADLFFRSFSVDVGLHWKTNWLWVALWSVLYYGCLVVIAIIWRPTINNTRYAYSEVNSEENEITLQPLNFFSDMVQRKKSENVESGPEPQAKPESPKSSELSVAFSIDDDEKEGESKMD